MKTEYLSEYFRNRVKPTSNSQWFASSSFKSRRSDVSLITGAAG